MHLTVRRGLSAILLAGLGLTALAADDRPTKQTAPARREFLFTYAATVTGLEPGQVARIWLPVPPNNEEQSITIVKESLPAPGRAETEPKYGNRILYVEARAGRDGSVPVAVTYKVNRKEVTADLQGKAPLTEDLAAWLRPDAKVPVDGKPLKLIEGKPLPMDQTELARVIYDIVNSHMRYSKEGTGWGQGDATWACDSRFGNCTDFHSLFISLARGKHIPAKFEMGFPLPEQRGGGEIPGYHCWAKFKPEGKGWIPVDISEANKNPKLRDYYFGNLTENRVMFTVGRDLTLVPRQDGPPLNYFIYPHVEVGGKPYPAEKVKRKFTYEDTAAGK
jgi:transglutaminase-like putative cysteine protease